MNRTEAFTKIANWFRGYLAGLDLRETRIRQGVELKAMHSLRVCIEIRHLGEQLQLDQDDLCLAKIIGLLHDVGRFEQYLRHGEFMDEKSVNHAQLGVEVLQRHGIPELLDADSSGILCKSILYHNKKHLPSQESDRVLLFARLVRDADKLDIYRIVTAYYGRSGNQVEAIDLGFSLDPTISPAVLVDLLAGRIVNNSDLRTVTDFKLHQIGWVYDVNFAPTYRRIRSKQFLRKIRTTLPPSTDFDRILAQAEKHVNSRCD